MKKILLIYIMLISFNSYAQKQNAPIFLQDSLDKRISLYVDSATKYNNYVWLAKVSYNVLNNSKNVSQFWELRDSLCLIQEKLKIGDCLHNGDIPRYPLHDLITKDFGFWHGGEQTLRMGVVPWPIQPYFYQRPIVKQEALVKKIAKPKKILVKTHSNITTTEIIPKKIDIIVYHQHNNGEKQFIRQEHIVDSSKSIIKICNTN